MYPYIYIYIYIVVVVCTKLYIVIDMCINLVYGPTIM